MSTNPDVDYALSVTEHFNGEFTKTYLCLDLWSSLDEVTDLAIKRSMLMYGFFAGRACYHAVYSDSLAHYIRSLLDSATFKR